MALKPDRVELLTDVSYFMNNATASTIERGGVVSVVTSGSGVSMDDGNAVVAYSAVGQAALPVGILLNDVVNLDLTRQHINWHKDEVQKGSKVTLLRQGQVTTDMIATAAAPGVGSGVYIGASGLLTTVAVATSGVSNGISCGRFLSSKDADGFCKVDINIT